VSIIKWNYTLVIRSLNSAGTVLHTWTPQTAIGSATSNYARPKRIGPPTYSPEFLDRELVNYSRRPYLVGYRAHLTLEWELPDYAIGRDTAYPAGIGVLYHLLNDLITAGAYLEVSLNNGANWKRMNLVSPIEYTAPEGKSVSIGLVMELEGADLQTVLPQGVIGTGAW
jgi:hypothetical protein